MKSILPLLIVTLSIVSFAKTPPPVPAIKASYTSCTNGTIHEVGDALLRVDVVEDGMTIFAYERAIYLAASLFEVEPADGKVKYRINEDEVEMTAEGETFTESVSGVIILSENNEKMAYDISIGRRETRSETLDCEKVYYEY